MSFSKHTAVHHAPKQLQTLGVTDLLYQSLPVAVIRCAPAVQTCQSNQLCLSSLVYTSPVRPNKHTFQLVGDLSILRKPGKAVVISGWMALLITIWSCLVFFLLHCWKSGDQGATPLLPPSSSVSCKCCALRQYNTIKWYKFLLAPSYDNCHVGAMWYALINSSLLSLLLNPAADKDLSRTVCGTEFHAAGMETAKFCSPHRTSAQHYQVTMSLCQYKQHKYGEINGSFAWKGTVRFNVPRDTLQVISQPITWVVHKPSLNQIKLQVTTQKPKQHSQRLYVYKQN